MTDLLLVAAVEPWWSGETAAWMGAATGVVVGVGYGAIGGGLCGGYLAPRGKAKPFVYGLFLSGIALGLGLLGVAGVALVSGQPYAVWYPMLLPGVLLTLLMGLLFPMVIVPAYRRAETRRLEAAELRRA
jgi:hypothetical protein